jgi:hypothetical protein
MVDLRKLNSATKYPSIPTYHKINAKGRLEPEVQVPFDEKDTEIVVTEKIDGTCGRILFTDQVPLVDDAGGRNKDYDRWYLIGSREELLTAQRDLIANDSMGIVTALRPIAERLAQRQKETQGGFAGDIVVGYFEVYGRGLPAARQYTGLGEIAARIFDAAPIPVSILDEPIEKISAWRDHGGQKFYSKKDVDTFIEEDGGRYGIQAVPFLGLVTTPLPTGIPETLAWMEPFRGSMAGLGGGVGRAEGIVIRTPDRKKIAKLRFEDYEKTLGIRR